MTAVASFWIAAAALAGALLSWLVRERECSLLRATGAEEKARSSELVVQLSRAEANAAEVRASLAAANERAANLQQMEKQMTGQFAGVAQRTLEGVSRTFLELATAKLGEERQAVKSVLAPVQDEFVKFSAAVSALQKNNAEDLGSLKASLAQVVQLQTSLQDAVRTTNDATGQLRNALQNPRVSGSWGEITLDRIVELAGMTEHCDFDRQTGVRSSEGTGERPDLMIRLTGGLRIPVNAKASAANYVRAASEADEHERERLLLQSATDLKARITELRGRAYDRVEGYAGMTFLFVPNESMLSSALALEPNLVEDALRYGIVICSPLLLLCYLRAFANGWRLQKQQENADEVARRGKMLHDRLQTFFASLGKVGWYLNHTVEKFNIAVGKMDNLLVPGRELGKLLGLTGELPTVDSVDSLAREARGAHNAPSLPSDAEDSLTEAWGLGDAPAVAEPACGRQTSGTQGA